MFPYIDEKRIFFAQKQGNFLEIPRVDGHLWMFF